jgi:hypothetical protein
MSNFLNKTKPWQMHWATGMDGKSQLMVKPGIPAGALEKQMMNHAPVMFDALHELRKLFVSYGEAHLLVGDDEKAKRSRDVAECITRVLIDSVRTPV